MNNLPTQNNIDIIPFFTPITGRAILSMKHWTKEQQVDYNEKCKKYYAAQENMIDIMEPVIITGSNNKNRLNVMIANALVEPINVSAPFHFDDPEPIYDEQDDCSLVRGCKYPPSQLIMALVHRLK